MTDERIRRLEAACGELDDEGVPVTFSIAAERSQIPRVTLYRNPALRAIVEERRTRGREANTLSGLAAEVAGLRAALEAVAERVRSHEERLRQLSKPKPTKKN